MEFYKRAIRYLARKKVKNGYLIFGVVRCGNHDFMYGYDIEGFRGSQKQPAGKKQNQR